jgi:putative nucleotidyltransferase with HDIG domain
MKKIEFFGRRLIFKLEKKKEEEREYDTNFDEIIGEKLIYLIAIMSIIVISSKILLFTTSTLNVGDLVTKDIVAPRSIKYNDRVAKERIIDDIINSSEKEYIYIPDVERLSLQKVDKAYNLLLGMKNGNLGDIDYDEFNRRTDLYISETLFEELKTQNLGTLNKNRNNIKNVLVSIYEKGITKDMKLIEGDSTFEELEKALTPEEKLIIKYFISPNYVYDEETTKNIIEGKVSQIDDIIVEIKGGSVIAKKGELITESQVTSLREYGLYSGERNAILLLANIVYLGILSVVFYYVSKKYLKKELLNKNKYRSLFLIVVFTFLSIRIVNEDFLYLIPMDALFFLLGILINIKFAGIMGAFVLLYSMPMVNFNQGFLITYAVAFLLSTYLVNNIKNRTTLINAGVQLGVTKLIVVILVSMFLRVEAVETILGGGEMLLSGIFSGMLTIALLPYFERTFNILTSFKLMELGDLSHPLLKELSVNAPGTFHHSMLVATLSENAAEAIGANAIFTRVASYYHDIGKMKRPNFYVENQQGGVNPHVKLSPSMSNLIITSHTRDGMEMAKEYGIPKEIRDIMVEHQGTTLLAYFYNKAKKTNPSVQEEDFRYSGPKPRTKESAIIMLADSIEAAVRSLDEKTSITIEKMIRKIISSKIEDNQLSEANLTFNEIEIIIKNFTKVIMGIHHVRIKYPGQK